MDSIVKAQLPNRKFRRLYWVSHKKQINEILSTVNIKYLRGVYKKFQKTKNGATGTRFYIRYSGYEFQVSKNTVGKELSKRAKLC